jgi:import inner membrane translocase subunit TIM22
MSYDTPLSPKGQQLADLPFRQQVRQGFKDMGSKSFSSAKNFGLVGLVFAGSECCIEGVLIFPVQHRESYADLDIVSSEE